MILDQLFITIYSLLNSHVAYKDFSNLEYRAVGILAAFLFINLISLSNLFDYQIIEALGKLLVLLIIILYSILLLMYAKKPKLEYLIKNWEEESESKKRINKRVFFSYAIISILLFLYVL